MQRQSLPQTLSYKTRCICVCVCLCLCFPLAVAQTADSLAARFKDPPSSAWPRTWWHWTRSNVTLDGITKDLEWMKRSGFAGFQLADVNAGGGQEVDEPAVFGTPAWLQAVRHTAETAERLGLEMAIFSSPGWSLTGGPWVKSEQAMKKLVWSEVRTEGHRRFSSSLPLPPSGEGPGPNLQNTPGTTGNFYRDVAVIAFPTPPGEDIIATPRVTTNTGIVEGNLLVDSDAGTVLTVRPAAGGDKAWIQCTYDESFPAKAITIAAPRGIPVGRVLASGDGKDFRPLVALPGKSGYRGGNIRTYAFPETSARYYRVEFTHAPRRPADIISETPTPVDTAYTVSEIHLHAGARINRWQDKAGFNFLFEYSGVFTPEVAPASAIDPASIIDLTDKLRADGTLEWTVPPGRWTIMRFGYALTGAKNRPAVPAALGYEVDKMNPRHVAAYLDAYTAPLKETLGSLYGKRLQYFLLDSWEAGIQNWTDIMPEQFLERRGYSLLPYLPTLAGRVLANAEVSERFLWDFRRTLVDMIAENHYKVVTDYLHKQNVSTYAEAGGVSLESIEDALLNKKYVDIPMGEFWVRDLHPSSMYYQDVRGAASSAHVYGKNIVAAEAFTGGNFESPRTLKALADYWFTQGINRLVFHTSAHQPLDTKPGNAMVGTHVHRNITWAEHVRALNTYLARCSYMLQRGTYVADIAYLLDEGAPSTMPFWGAGLQPPCPDGYQFDYVNADVVLNLMTVSDEGKLVLPGGMTYAMLVLPPSDRMTLPMLRKIRQLIAGGAIVVGPRPRQSQGMAGYPTADEAIEEIALDMWADLDGASRTHRAFGQGLVAWGLPLDQFLEVRGIAMDVDFNCDEEELAWIHRRDGDTDLYFIVNRTDRALDVTGHFRINGRDVHVWDPGDGSVKPAAYVTDSISTSVSMTLSKQQAVFVVFRGTVSQTSRSISQQRYEELTTLAGPWEVSYPEGWGAPGHVTFPQLVSWTESADEGIRYFSGTATYTKEFNIRRKWLAPGMSLLVDLGKVRDMAEVFVNGKRLDFLWYPPFTADITAAAVPGRNVLEIRATNQWTNRLAGDAAHPDRKVLASSPRPFGMRGYEVAESGLMGPVKVVGRLGK